MRVAFVTNNYTPYAAGVVKSIDAITAQLRMMGHEVLIIAPQFLPHHDDPEYVVRIPSFVRFMYKKKHMAVSWRAKHYLKKFINQFSPDVVHVHHPFLLGQVASSIANKMGLPVFFTYHTIYEDYVHYVPLPSCIVKPMVTKQVLNFCASVDHVIAPSTGIQEYLSGHGIRDTTVIASPLRKEFYVEQWVRKVATPPYQLICVSRFAKEKNLLMLFEVLGKLSKEYHITFVGYGHLEAELRESARNFSGRVHFVINPTLEVLLEVYQKAHIFLFPSQTDTQGIVLAESMAMGTPVIALDGVGQRDIIKEGINGFIVSDALHMAHTIQQVLESSTLYNRLQQQARESIGRYAPEQIVWQLLKAYQMAQ